MTIFKTQLKLDPKNQQETAGNGDGQANQINHGIYPVFQYIPERYFQVMNYHII
jgi:hypothetical protein